MMGTISEIEVSYLQKTAIPFSKKIETSEDAAKILFDNWDKNTIGLYESFKVLLLNNGNQVKGIYEVSKGGITGTLVDMRILFAVILKTLSVSVILCHYVE